jgi:hypothetical protein
MFANFICSLFVCHISFTFNCVVRIKKSDIWKGTDIQL